jgi:hypothetical protein
MREFPPRIDNTQLSLAPVLKGARWAIAELRGNVLAEIFFDFVWRLRAARRKGASSCANPLLDLLPHTDYEHLRPLSNPSR